MGTPRLVLASASPRRRELLARVGYRFETDPSSVEEVQLTGEEPLASVLRLSVEKASSVLARRGGAGEAVLGADTTVVLEGEMIGKPRDRRDAVELLLRLRGRNHLVYTAWALLWAADYYPPVCGYTVSTVRMREFSARAARAYVGSGEADDKAGAYAVQGLGSALVAAVFGCVDNVIGLPLCQLRPVLASRGIRPLAGRYR
ncbi:MAG: Maf family protein [Candidatus Binatia bacterium]